jgi:hypothetical protein
MTVCLFCKKSVEKNDWKLIEEITKEDLDEKESELVVFHQHLGFMCLKHRGVVGLVIDLMKLFEEKSEKN